MKNNAVLKYFVGSWAELKRVSWPTRQQIVNHTVIVLAASIIAIGITSAIDYGLTTLVQYLIENKK